MEAADVVNGTAAAESPQAAKEEGRPELTRDVIVVGASAGGVEALQELIGGLPAEFPASIFVVLHVLATGKSLLPAILARCGELPVAAAVDGEPIERGRVYVAPPDHHMLVRGRHVRLTRGPRENGHRPAVDPLFRSAARSHGSRVIAVVLSGSLDDGALGTQFVKDRGGLVIVQDLADALYAEMPASVLETVSVDHAVPLREMPALLGSLLEEEVTPVTGNSDGEPEPEIAKPGTDVFSKVGSPSRFSCPECGGVLWEQRNAEFVHYRCQVGHAYSPNSLVTAHGKSVEGALWTAMRSLEERADLLRRLARRSRSNRGTLASRFEARASHAEDEAGLLRDTIERLAGDVRATDA